MRNMLRQLAVLSAVGGGWMGTLGGMSAACLASEPAAVSFRRDIAPILLDNCLACHSPKNAEGGYRVDCYAELLKAGDSGATPVEPQQTSDSELLRRIACSDESERMPAESDPLAAGQIALVQRWIAEGAQFDGDDPQQPLALVIPPADYPTGPQVYAHPLPIAALAFSPDGRQLATSGYYEVLLWDVVDGKLQRRIGNLGQRIYALQFSPDGRSLAVACGDPGRTGEVRVVDFETGKISGVPVRTHDVVLDIAYRPDGQRLAVASADSTVRVVDMSSQQVVLSLASHADWVTAVAWNADGSRMASASRDKTVKVYQAETGDLIANYQGHSATVRDVAWLGDGSQAVSVGADHKLHRWEIEGVKKVGEVDLGAEGFQVVLWDQQALVPCADGRLRLIDVPHNKVIRDFGGYNDWVLSAALLAPPPTAVVAGQEQSAEPPRLAGGSFNGQVRVWRSEDAELLQQWLAKP